jgi:hypothetical protein
VRLDLLITALVGLAICFTFIGLAFAGLHWNDD